MGLTSLARATHYLPDRLLEDFPVTERRASPLYLLILLMTLPGNNDAVTGRRQLHAHRNGEPPVRDDHIVLAPYASLYVGDDVMRSLVSRIVRGYYNKV